MKKIEQHKKANILALNFSSDLSLLPEIVIDSVKFIAEWKADVNIPQLKLVLYEGLTNAIKHGNKTNSEKKVAFELAIKEDWLYITIKDEGNGFNWQKTIQNDMPEVASPSGRGILFMKACGFSIHYNNKGNVLILSKKLANV